MELKFIPAHKVHYDRRGSFVKTYSASEDHSILESVRWKEEYYTRSVRSVLRGLHFQRSPSEHHKLVTCLVGSIRDVVVDLRVGDTFGMVSSFSLSDECPGSLFIPVGHAHGFIVDSDEALVAYKTSSDYDPSTDLGVRWDSIDFDWRITSPILSDRDKSFPPISYYRGRNYF